MKTLAENIIAFFEANAPDDIKDELIAEIKGYKKKTSDTSED